MEDQPIVIRRPKVEFLTGLRRSQLYSLMERDEFPKPIRLSASGRSVGWLLADVVRWIDERVAASRKNRGRHAS